MGIAAPEEEEEAVRIGDELASTSPGVGWKPTHSGKATSARTMPVATLLADAHDEPAAEHYAAADALLEEVAGFEPALL